MKVYVVSSGIYDDYHIDAVFATKEKADVYVLDFKRNPRSTYFEDMKVEVWEVE